MLLTKALIHFKDALDCHDGETVPDTNFKLAQCLKYNGDLQSAIASYQAAYELMTHTTNDFKRKVAHDILCTMFQYYSSQGNPGTLLKDFQGHIAHWLESIVSEFSADDLQQILNESTKKHFIEFVEVLRFIIDTSSLTHGPMIQKCLEYLQNSNQGEWQVKRLIERYRQQQLQQVERVQPNNEAYKGYYSPPHKARHSSCDYDFYIINDEDAPNIVGWVRHLLLPGLECPFYGLKGYYHQRDAKLGQPEVTTQGMAMEKSAYVIVLISNGFSQNQECINLTNIASKMAKEDKGNVVILQKEPVPIPTFLNYHRQFDFSCQSNVSRLARYLSHAIRSLIPQTL